MVAIERARELPEPVRRQILWTAVFVCSLVIASLWFVTLRWQLSSAKNVSATPSSSESASRLPGIGESLKRDSSSLAASFRGVLQDLLLKEDSAVEEKPSRQESLEGSIEFQDSSPSLRTEIPLKGAVPRLPR